MLHIIFYGYKWKAFADLSKKALKASQDKSVVMQFAIDYYIKNDVDLCVHNKDASVDFRLRKL